MMKQLKYQNDTVNELVDKTITLLKLDGNRHKLIFKAPTGSGKTVMTAIMLDRLIVEMQNRGDCPYQEAAFIWIAPNKLHEQSFRKIKQHFDGSRNMDAMRFEDLTSNYLRPSDILFVNWESINKDNNRIVREDECGRSLYDITFNTKLKNIPIIVIIDEEHLFWSSTADKSKKVLDCINPKLELRISATPKSHSDYKVTIPREKVIEEEMIKRGVVMNPELRLEHNNEIELNQFLIENALRKRNELSECYEKLGVNINPLLLIQLPNDTKESLTADDKKIAEQVKLYLSAVQGIDVENHKLAVWLSGEKENLEGLERDDSLTEVLLFKQAIALGWDCPRAAVLLIFRKLESETFTVQTVGRILRMPEQKYYTDDNLNIGYVYTDVSKDKIQIIAEDASYLSKQNYVAKRKEGLKNISIKSYYMERKSELRNVLKVEYKRYLQEAMERKLHMQMQPLLFSYEELYNAITEKKDTHVNSEEMEIDIRLNREQVSSIIDLNVRNINIPIPQDVKFQNDIGTVDIGTQVRYSRTLGELKRIFYAYCRSMLHDFESESTERLARYIMDIMASSFNMPDSDIIKCVLYHKNKRVFSDIISSSLADYKKIIEKNKREAKNKSLKSYMWKIPEERIYEEETHHLRDDTELHALQPFAELNVASNPEICFASFLEENSEHIDWWYKNGDSGKHNYSVPYTNNKGYKSLFYVDFVIRLKNGDIYLFDTKSIESDPEAVNKHNALIDYLNAERQKGKQLFGGVIIYSTDNWKYSHFHIEDTMDVAPWDAFEPRLANTIKK